MDYIFGVKGSSETLKTIGEEIEVLEGWQEIVREYDDCIITDQFLIISHDGGFDDSKLRYDFYTIAHHNRIIDKTKKLKAAQEDTDALIVEQEERILMLELGL